MRQVKLWHRRKAAACVIEVSRASCNLRRQPPLREHRGLVASRPRVGGVLERAAGCTNGCTEVRWAHLHVCMDSVVRLRHAKGHVHIAAAHALHGMHRHHRISVVPLRLRCRLLRWPIPRIGFGTKESITRRKSDRHRRHRHRHQWRWHCMRRYKARREEVMRHQHLGRQWPCVRWRGRESLRLRLRREHMFGGVTVTPMVGGSACAIEYLAQSLEQPL